jgi:hypothetical protein
MGRGGDSAARTCIFCGGTPITREHIFSRKWLASMMPSDAPFRHAHRRTGEGEFEAWWTKHEADLVVSCVCSTCNNGWMDDLDRRAQGLVTPMTDGQQVDLRHFCDQGLISAWVCKTAMVADHVQLKPFLPSEDNRYLFEVRQPPMGWWIWLAATTPSREGYEAVVDARTLEGSGEGGFSSTLVLNSFIAQVLVPPHRTTSYPDRSANRHLFLRVWPPTYETTEWPPPSLMPRAALPDFLKAFTD